MKNWHSHLFPIVLLGLLAGLSFWLQRTVDRDELPKAKVIRHDPDAIVENLSARRFDENGLVKYRLVAPFMMHFADDDSSELQSPTLVTYRPGAPPVTITGRHARVTAKGEAIYLWDDVVVNRGAMPERPAITGRMPDLLVQPNLGTAFTNSPVEITQDKSWVKGTGISIDNNTSTFVLQSRVTGLYFPSKATK